MFGARAKAADLQTEANRQRLSDLRNNIARDVRNAWHDTNRACERLSVTQKTAADIEDTDAKYQYRLTQIVLAFTMSAPK
jgi:outer membrane protein TolC